LDTRGKFGSVYAQDSVKVRPNLTLNYGLRWEFSPPWFDTQGRIEQIIWGEQSKIYPDSPTGWVFPGDPGVPNTLAPARYNNVAPRVGLAYSPGFTDGILSKIFGGPGQSSIRLSFGTFYTAIEDLTMNYEIGVPPFAAYFLNPGPVYLETPFKSSYGSPNIGQRFPYEVPPPGSTGFWGKLLPIADDAVYEHSNVLPYAEDFNFNVQRSIHNSTVLTLSYVGTRGHHLLAAEQFNPGNPTLCLQVRAILGPAQGCGPYGEDAIYDLGNRHLVYGTRSHSVTSGRYINQGLVDFAELFGLGTIGNSNYNAMQVTLEKKVGAFQFLGAYTWSKSLGDSSFLTDNLNPFNAHLDKSLSAFDISHNFVISYIYNLPVLSRSKTGFLHKLLVLLCYKRKNAAKRAAGKLRQQHSGNLHSQCRDGSWIMPLGADASRAVGSSAGFWGLVGEDARPALRGKNGSVQPPGTRRPQDTGWRDDGSRANHDLPSARAPVLA
jgi:hypothetical protein